ncbi:reverse transcriptase [Senna tora]|uniref:Reverse transcriptase n=1 Tax=Senna tora TaxID=362788 RepID=A0A834WGZ5_9FABA|nr:reverse transcriptase [Senna tora]
MGYAGGLWLLWDDAQIKLRVIEDTFQEIHALVEVNGSPFAILSFVYGSPSRDRRKILWANLVNLSSLHNLPWLVGGDFNEILSSDEKWGGPKFTWCNKRPNGQIVFERLDRFLGNAAWVNLFPHSVNFHLPRIRSDHNPMLLRSRPIQGNRNARPFRCERIWINHPDFLNVVQEAWGPSGNLSSKLVALKIKAIEWNRVSLGNIFHKKKILTRRLNGIGIAMNSRPSPQLALLEQELSIQYRKILLSEEELWASKARLDWLHLGDGNTKFLLTSVINRRRQNRILGLKNNMGEWIQDPVEIKNMIVNYFIECFSHSQVTDFPSHLCHPNAHSALSGVNCSIPNLDEIKRALWDLKPFKAAGVDGFQPGFFQKYWDIVGITIINKIQECDRKSVEAVNRVLSSFLAMSGLMVNESKSSIWFSPNSSDDERSMILNAIPFRRSVSPGTYLGFPLGKGTKKRDYENIINKIRDKEFHKPWAKVCAARMSLNSGKGSVLGKCLKVGSEWVIKGTKTILNSGCNTNFWLAEWSTLGNIRSTISGSLNLGEEALTVADLRIPSDKWNWDQFSFVFLDSIKKFINAVPFGASNSSDKSVWKFDSKGVFTLNSAYKAIESSKCSPSSPNLTWIWKLKCHRRQKFFIWLCVKDALPHKSNLFHRGINLNAFCSLCGNQIESMEHIFKLCPVSSKVWEFAAPNLNFILDDDMVSWIRKNSFASTQVQFQVPHGTLFIYVLQQIWFFRNNAIFNNKDFDVPLCFRNALSKAAEFSHLAGNFGSGLVKEPVIIKWQVPPEGWWKINTDGSCHTPSYDIAAGGVIRDHSGNWILGFSKYIGGGPILCAELWAILFGLEQARRIGGAKVIVESDSLAAINLISDLNIPASHHYFPIISRCRSSLALFDDATLTHKFREVNQVADALAKFVVQSKCELTCFQSAPPFLAQAFWSDYFGHSFFRGRSFSFIDAG